jgi:hypothetical protein
MSFAGARRASLEVCEVSWTDPVLGTIIGQSRYVWKVVATLLNALNGRRRHHVVSCLEDMCLHVEIVCAVLLRTSPSDRGGLPRRSIIGTQVFETRELRLLCSLILLRWTMLYVHTYGMMQMHDSDFQFGERT